MLILAIRTDQPEAEVGLFDDHKKLVCETWQAHRELAETIHRKIATLSQKQGKDWGDIEGVVVFEGPGSFTGLRIGISVANSLAYGLPAPIIGTTGKNWIEDGIQALMNGKNDQQVLPNYGSEPHVTKPRK